MKVTRLAPALALGLNRYVAPFCAAAVREARVRHAWREFEMARLAAHEAHGLNVQNRPGTFADIRA